MWKILGRPNAGVNGPKFTVEAWKKDAVMKKFKTSKNSGENTRFNSIQYLTGLGIYSSITKNPISAKFDPAKSVTRKEMALWMYAMAGEPKYTPTAKDKKAFADIKTTDKSKAAKAIWWLSHNKIAFGSPVKKGKGKSTTTLYYYNPKNTVNRGSMAEFLVKLYTNVLSR
jgi:hypothetical protein